MVSIVNYLFENDDLINRAKKVINKVADSTVENISKGKAGEAIYDKLHPEDPWSFDNRRFKYMKYLATHKAERGK